MLRSQARSMVFVTTTATFVVAFLSVVFVCAAQVAAQTKPVTDDDLTTMIRLGIDDQAIVERIQKSGLGFSVDDDILARLKTAGASDVVIAAIRKAGEKNLQRRPNRRLPIRTFSSC